MVCRIEMHNGNSSYQKILIKEMEIFCEFVGVIEITFLDTMTSGKVI